MRFLPEAVEPRPKNEPRYVRSYVCTRFAIGLLGVLLPPVLVFLEPTLFDGLPFPRGSLSAYYYSGVREIFVGGLWAIGVFLVVYKLLDLTGESLLSSLAGVAAILVAVFPTERPGDGWPLTPFQEKLGEGAVTAIHYGSAIAFIALLVPITLFFAHEEGGLAQEKGRLAQKERRRHRKWKGFHTIAAVLILSGAALAAFTGITGGPDRGVLIGEWIAIWAFGLSWLAKGSEWKTLIGRGTARSGIAGADGARKS
jgi:hypothetical protein